MKKSILFFGLCTICLSLFAQETEKSVLSEALIGTTKYDQQTNKSCQNRMYLFPDGTIGATWMWSQTTTFDDRGTGYNYFNGSAWGSYPTARIETVKSGWPSYAPFGANGELFVSHKALLAPLNIAKRTNKGSGGWTLSTIPAPPGVTGMLWARVVTNGPDHTNIHVIANTAPVSNGGSYYQGLNGAILYNRSTNGGSTWNGWQLLTGMTSSQYLGFSADTYEWANPKGDTLCFVVGDCWNDLFIMKSNNNGTTWTKTIIWNCLFDKWTGGSTAGPFYCPDGSNAVALDNQGIAHVVCGRQKVSGDYYGNKSWVPYTDGLLYWNENQPPFIQGLDSATLTNNHQFIGYVQDPAVWTAGPTALPYYYLSLSSMPAIMVDQNNHIFVIWSGVTNHRDQNNFMLRHIYARASVCNGSEWCPIVELTGGSGYNSLECAYPGISPTSDANVYFLYQVDNLGGNYIRGLNGAQGQNAINTNDIRVQNAPKSTIYCGASPVVDFTASNLNPIVGQTVVLTDLSANCPTDWQWSFSPSTVTFVGGTTPESINPNVQFTAVGAYSVTLTASNYFGTGALTKTDYITVSPPPPPSAGFYANMTNIYAGDEVQFTDQSTGNPTSWTWTFEGGTPSGWNGKTPPPVEYLSTGSFDVTLQVSNQYGNGSTTKTDYIVVAVPPPPIADFTGEPTTVNVGSSVQFTDQSTYNPTSWAWTFDGGDPSTSDAEIPPPVTYNSEGQFTVSLIVGNVSGSDTITKPQYITAVIPIMPLADFSGSPTVLYAGGQVQFTDMSTGAPDSWEWTFAGGSPASSGLQYPPPVTYSSAGEFDVTLKISNANGNNTMIKAKYITVLNTGAPMAGFSGTPTILDAGNQVQFTDESTGDPAEWQWTFDGGEPGVFSGQSPAPVMYNAPGSYDVSLKVTNQNGTHTLIIPAYITVTNPYTPQAGFSADKRNITIGDSVQFTDESTGFPLTYSWAFEGGTPSASSLKTPPRIVYAARGVFDVVLIVSNENGTNSMIQDGYISVGGIGIEEGDPGQVSIYPNPASTRFTLATSIQGILSIHDLYGQQLLTREVTEPTTGVDISTLPSGVYLVRLVGEKGVHVAKIIKK